MLQPLGCCSSFSSDFTLNIIEVFFFLSFEHAPNMVWVIVRVSLLVVCRRCTAAMDLFPIYRFFFSSCCCCCCCIGSFAYNTQNTHKMHVFTIYMTKIDSSRIWKQPIRITQSIGSWNVNIKYLTIVLLCTFVTFPTDSDVFCWPVVFIRVRRICAV